MIRAPRGGSGEAHILLGGGNPLRHLADELV